MSIIGQPQEFNTVKSSWEVLDSPVPLRTGSSGYSSEAKLSRVLNSSSPDISMIQKPEYSIGSIEVNSKPFQTVAESLHKTEQKLTDSPGKSQNDVQEQSLVQDQEYSKVTVNDKELSTQPIKPGGATYVATQKRPSDDIAVAVASEFEQHVRQTQRKRRENIPGETKDSFDIKHSILKEGTEYSEDDLSVVTSKATPVSNASVVNERVYSDSGEDDSYEHLDRNELGTHISDISIENTGSIGIQGRSPLEKKQDLREDSPASDLAENNDMATAHLEETRTSYGKHGAMPKHTKGRDINVNLDPVRVPNRHDRITTNGHIYGQNRRYTSREDQHYRKSVGNNSQASHNNSVATRSPHTTLSSRTPANEVTTHIQSSNRDDPHRHHGAHGKTKGTHDDAENSPGTHRPVTRDSAVSDGTRSMPDGVDNPQFPPSTAEEDGVEFPRQNIPFPNHTGSLVSLRSVPPPNYHPPPTIIQNGVPKEELVELMNKGLSNFTTEMAVMVIDKLKPEYETLAKQVGEQVKELTVTELKELREKLQSTETELESVKVERDNLKIENAKERDQMKKEFEKDRLKRVAEFEEKKELIDNLQKENEQFKNAMKDKDKALRKAEAKAKAEEQKRLKSEEEAEKKLKDMQKELDKAKGELLVQKSKIRLQVSSAKEKKESLARLNSHHGVGPKKFNGHKPIPYDEGDDDVSEQ